MQLLFFSIHSNQQAIVLYKSPQELLQEVVRKQQQHPQPKPIEPLDEEIQHKDETPVMSLDEESDEMEID
jgi:hypothetical protein